MSSNYTTDHFFSNLAPPGGRMSNRDLQISQAWNSHQPNPSNGRPSTGTVRQEAHGEYSIKVDQRRYQLGDYDEIIGDKLALFTLPDGPTNGSSNGPQPYKILLTKLGQDGSSRGRIQTELYFFDQGSGWGGGGGGSGSSGGYSNAEEMFDDLDQSYEQQGGWVWVNGEWVWM